jgi:hypothetical protein
MWVAVEEEEEEERGGCWTVKACSNEGSESGGIPIERGTLDICCWMTLRCMRCFWQS